MTAAALRLEHLQVMIVDDNQHMRAIIRTILRGVGISRVIELGDAIDAFEYLRSSAVDVVIIDHRMNNLDGTEFVQMLRRAPDSPAPYIPIIMATGHGDRAHVEAARDAGVTEFLVKPITPRAVLQRLDAVLTRPRPFIKSRGYTGPDRRRGNPDHYAGPKRRAVDMS